MSFVFNATSRMLYCLSGLLSYVSPVLVCLSGLLSYVSPVLVCLSGLLFYTAPVQHKKDNPDKQNSTSAT
jgi:EamA domain-containing membrane protein RarD